ncbi:MFS transporter [Enterococcus sp. HY326]|uniref:MFS transporter n=1 Tax=Enterococcus sp. HY326 TaxID=2971265 RepID=UPI00223F5D30|nr:MFS transporter [Enterococcus sp. HY326]
MEISNKNKMNRMFLFSSLALIGLFAASASPIPLYSNYTVRIDLTKSLISLTAVFYFVGCIISLIILSRLANYIGRKPVALTALILGLIGLAFLIAAEQPVMIIIARFFQGLSCGLASSVLSLLIVESGILKKSSLVTAISGSAIFLGLGIGGLLSGALVQINSNGASLVYWIILLFLVVCLVGIVFSNETLAERRKGALKSLVPNISIPDKAKPYALPAAFLFITSWSMGGYFQAYSSTVGAEIFNINSPLLAAIILSMYMIPNPIGIRIGQFFSRTRAQQVGEILYASSVGLLVVSFTLQSLILCFIAVLGAGISQGISYSSAMQNLLDNSKPEEKAGVLSFIYLLSYGGAALPSFISGRISSVVSFTDITFAYFILNVILCLLTLVFLKRMKKVSGRRKKDATY